MAAPEGSPTTADSASGARRRTGLGALMAAAGFVSATGSLSDNSFLTHLATGRLIWETGGFPRTDPYTFTAAGDSWPVQSWLASVLFAGAERLGDLTTTRLLVALVTAAAVFVCWRLTAPAGSAIARLAAFTPLIVMATSGWTHRPYLFAFLCLALLVLALEGGLPPPALLAVGWLWFNTHGSWPLGIGLVALTWLGARLDGAGTSRERRVAAWFAGGLAAGVLNPYGPSLVLIPLGAVQRRELFSNIVEWQPPDYEPLEQLAFLVLVAAFVLVQVKGRPTWRDNLPFAAFAVAALYSSRNVSPAGIVAVPALARGVAPLLGGLRATLPPVVVHAAAALLAVAGLLQLDRDPDFNGRLYPEEATLWLEEEGLDPTRARVIAREYVGNYFEARYGTDARVFVDDRFELQPTDVAEDVFLLLEGGEGWEEALARYEPDAVLWERDSPLAQILAESEDWRIEYRDELFVVAVPA